MLLWHGIPEWSVNNMGHKDDNYLTCLHCGAYDPDYGSCTLPSSERAYACPLAPDEIEEDEIEENNYERE